MKYSVAIPAYKAKFLKECINSVLQQSFQDFELIIVNDNSPENIYNIVAEFNDERIRYYENKVNKGAENVVDNWNICLSYAVGDFFVLLGDDDVLMPNYLEEFDALTIKFFDKNIFHCRSYIIDENSAVVGFTPSWPEEESVYENMWHRLTKLRLQYVSDFVYRRDVLVKFGGFYKMPMAWASDDITSFLLAKENGIAHSQSFLFCYRDSKFSLSNSKNLDLKMKAILEEEKWYQNFLSRVKPYDKNDGLYYDSIKREYKKCFLKKRIETIAYSGIFRKNSLMNFVRCWKNSKDFELNLQHLFYAYILAIKQEKNN